METQNITEQWRDSTIDNIEKMFEKDGEIVPVVLMMVDKGVEPGMIIMPIHELLQTGDTKDDLVSIVKKICKKEKVMALMMVTEAWMAVDKNTDNINVPVSTRSDRKECVMITYETHFVCKTYVYEIDRDSNAPTLKNPITADTNTGGRFMNMLSKKISSN